MIATRRGHFVEPVVLAEHLGQSRRVTMQHLHVSFLRLETPQNPAIEMRMQRHTIARLRAIALPVPYAMRKEHNRSFRHFDRNSTFAALVRARRTPEFVAAGYDPGWSRLDAPILKRPHTDAGQ